MIDVFVLFFRLLVFPGLCFWILLSGYRELRKLRYAIDYRVVADLRRFREELAEFYKRRKLYLCIYCSLTLIIAGTNVWYVQILHDMQGFLPIVRTILGICVAISAILLSLIAIALIEKKRSFEVLDLYSDNRIDKQAVISSFYRPYVLQKTSYLLLLVTAIIMIILSPLPQ